VFARQRGLLRSGKEKVYGQKKKEGTCGTKKDLPSAAENIFETFPEPKNPGWGGLLALA